MPVELRSITLAPGERVEILVDLSDGRSVALETAPDANASLMMMGPLSRLQSFASDLFGEGKQPLIRFEPGPGEGRAAVVPTRLAPRERLDPARAARRRRLVLNMGMGGMMGINGRPFDMDRIDERVRLGDVEIWEASGDMMAHPLHIHGVHFEVLSRNGSKPTIRDQGLRDTVLVREPVELLVRFTQPAVKAPFMYHCHILEHEDNGMMGQFVTS